MGAERGLADLEKILAAPLRSCGAWDVRCPRPDGPLGALWCAALTSPSSHPHAGRAVRTVGTIGALANWTIPITAILAAASGKDPATINPALTAGPLMPANGAPTP